MADCIFCRIVSREILSTIVCENESTLAFMDIGSVNPGHVLIVCKSHVDDLYGLDDKQAAAVFQTTTQVAKAINKAFTPQGISVYQANGKAAGQTVFHFHIHVVPRNDGDGMKLVWPIKNPPRAALEEAAAKIRHAL